MDGAGTNLLQIVSNSAGRIGLGRNDSQVTAGNTLGAIHFYGNDGGTYQECAVIRAEADGDHANNDKPSRLVFSTTADGASSPTERMRICSTSSNNDLLYLSCTGRSGYAPNTLGGRIYQDNGNCKVRAANGVAAFQFYSASGGTSSAVGSIVINASSTSYNTSSDYRLKENVVDLDGAITRVKQLAPKRFNFIADADTIVDGFLAHETQTVVPEAVTGTKDEVDDDGNAVMQGIDQSKLVPLLTAALQEAIAKIETLEAKVSALEAN
jgi:hypothetical protein